MSMVGVLNCFNGDKYDGDFVEDEKFGNGIQTYANGDRYNGQWKSNQREGTGEVCCKC